MHTLLFQLAIVGCGQFPPISDAPVEQTPQSQVAPLGVPAPSTVPPTVPPTYPPIGTSQTETPPIGTQHFGDTERELNLSTTPSTERNTIPPITPTTIPSTTIPPTTIPPTSFQPSTEPARNNLVNENTLSTPTSTISVAPTPSPKQLLQLALATPRHDALAGIPIPLSDVLVEAKTRDQRLAAVRSYWRLSIAVASYHHSVEEVDFLSGVTAPAFGYGNSLLLRAQAAAKARLRETRLAAITAQHEVDRLRQSAAGDSLPLPLDFPVVGTYRTRFDELSENRPVLTSLRKLHATLPHYHDLLDSRATSVAASEQSRQAAKDAFQSGQLQIADLINEHTHLRDERIAFLKSVKNYNTAIATYALNIVSSRVSRNAVVSMLVVGKASKKHDLSPNPAAMRTAELRSQTSRAKLVPVKPRPTTIFR